MSIAQFTKRISTSFCSDVPLLFKAVFEICPKSIVWLTDKGSIPQGASTTVPLKVIFPLPAVAVCTSANAPEEEKTKATVPAKAIFLSIGSPYCLQLIE